MAPQGDLRAPGSDPGAVEASPGRETVRQLAGRLSHDFNNHLAVVLTYAQLIEQEIASEAPDLGPMREDIAEMIRAARAAIALAGRLGEYRRRSTPPRAAIDLGEALAALEPEIRGLLRAQVALTLNVAESAAPVAAHPDQVRILVLSLVANSVEAMASGGTLLVELHPVEIASDSADGPPRGRHLRLAVTDSGEGMDAHLLETAFEPFFTTRPRAGAGLGLATVQGILRENRWPHRLASTPGAGTCFETFLPFAEDSARKEP